MIWTGAKVCRYCDGKQPAEQPTIESASVTPAGPLTGQPTIKAAPVAPAEPLTKKETWIIGVIVAVGLLLIMWASLTPQREQEPSVATGGLQKAAEPGDTEPQVELAEVPQEGSDVLHDYVGEMKRYRKAADQGDATAQSNLGWMYLTGEGVTQDDTTAMKWYRKAADQGDANAQAFVGWMYAVGRGVTQDYREAVKWYRKAADQGDASHQFVLVPIS
jgi:hypothetical protein